MFILLTMIAVIIASVSARRNKQRSLNNLNPDGGYTPQRFRPGGFTHEAYQRKVDWANCLDHAIDERARKIAEQEKFDLVDEKIMKRAILDVIQTETTKWSDQIRR